MTADNTTEGSDIKLAHRMVGKIDVTTYSDGHLELPGEFFSSGAEGTVSAGANVWLVVSKGRQFLIDTGSGAFLADRFPETGQLGSELDRTHIHPREVTDVVLTHMHADHIGGFIRDGELAFPTAKIHVSATEWNFWTAPDLLEQSPDTMKPLVQLVQSIADQIKDQVVTHEGESDLGDGLTLVPAAGHTPGHSAVRLEDGGAQFWILGDAIISGALQFADPDITYALDADPAQAVATRRSLLSDLAASGSTFAATHLAYPGSGTVTTDGTGFAFKPDAD